ncbi:hypothetical protein RJ640_027497 [Escallonia rubra]|uniref:High chlorophyll fluorescence 153 n=1 Tax=Escallonia rubra TaxID=112253 RepID=A0AA88QZ26_9ASTE|nr:hypothetical protein RJ640_027497 [Escallonia rubra]
MGSLIVTTPAPSPSLYSIHTSQPRSQFKFSCVPSSRSVFFPGELGLRKTRGSSVSTRAVPGPSTFVFAFVFPLSLLAATIFTASRIADKLDSEYLEELAINQAILEADEDGDDDAGISLKEEPPLPRTRNRPKREAEPSSK